ncbi:uncharacterized protein LOC128670489 [Plodia interpunctella]|uniref:uncharacterized protein LOC128670489 n=1 Tax=Plodia interpunctella TaxID=58824 RepID=UPI00236808F9|nr:uncharacterized protein LOC128670489 [Plodia interpunctella]
MYMILLTITLRLTMAQDVTLNTLDNGPGILPFKLGPTKMITHYHSFLYYIDLDMISLTINSVKSQIDSFRSDLNNKTASLYEPHISHLYNKIEMLLEQIHSFQHTRSRRGLVDGLGSIIKSVSGNLDYTDAIKYDNAIKVLQNNEKQLETELNEHISLGKEWIAKHSIVLDSIVKNQNRLANSIDHILNSDASRDYDMIKYAHLAQYLIIISDNTDNLYEEIHNLENMVAFIQSKTTAHYMINISTLNSTISRLRQLYSEEQIINIDLREYYEIIKTGSYYVGNKLAIVFMVPIASPLTYTLYKLSIAPNKQNQILVPIQPYVAIQETDSMYIATECPKVNTWYICKEELQQKIRDNEDCIQHLIMDQSISSSCQFIHANLTSSALEKLDDQHYTISLPTTTRLHISCRQEYYKNLQGTYLVSVPPSCMLKTLDFVISNVQNRIKGHAVQIAELPTEELATSKLQPTVRLNSINLEHLHETNAKISLQHPATLQKNDLSSLYHTTIPSYTLLFGTFIFALILTLYWKLRRRSSKSKDEDIPKADYPDGHYSRIQDIKPKDVKIDISNIPAISSVRPTDSCRSAGGGVTRS